MTVGDRYPLTIFGRLLTCTKCGCHVDLIELPRPWIDASAYQCGTCLEPVNETAEYSHRDSHTVVHREPPAPPKQRWTYDPATAPIPF